jgi:uncharacterized cupin superfamily protein
MSDRPKIVVLDRLQTGESANPSPEKILAGIPRTRVSNQYADRTQQFFCGLWTSTSGKWRIRYTEHELCLLIEGRVRIESSGGERNEFKAGDAFVVPAGFEGIWEVVEPCKKWYAVFEERPAAAAAEDPDPRGP